MDTSSRFSRASVVASVCIDKMGTHITNVRLQLSVLVYSVGESFGGGSCCRRTATAPSLTSARVSLRC